MKQKQGACGEQCAPTFIYFSGEYTNTRDPSQLLKKSAGGGYYAPTFAVLLRRRTKTRQVFDFCFVKRKERKETARKEAAAAVIMQTFMYVHIYIYTYMMQQFYLRHLDYISTAKSTTNHPFQAPL